MAMLASAADAVVAFLAEAPPAALGEAMIDCRRQMDRLEAGFTQAAGRFAANREYAAEGAPTAVSWLKANCRLSAGAAAERLNIARQLDQLPDTGQAFTSGELGYQHAALIARVASQVGTDTVREAEGDLLRMAADFDPNRFSLVTRRLRHVVDPDGALADANRAYEQRYLQVSPSLDGIFLIDGRLDPEGGAMLQTALSALMHPVSGDTRRAEQRRADALVELCRRQLDSGALPQTGRQKPHLSITVSAAALAGMPGTEGGDLNWAGTVPAQTVQRLACDASLSMIPLDSQDLPIDVGRATRSIPPALGRALRVRDGGCRFPGCDAPIDWTHGHHLHHWTAGGETKLANLYLLCAYHHRLVHEGGWRLVREDDGSLQAIPPPSGRARRQPVVTATSTAGTRAAEAASRPLEAAAPVHLGDPSGHGSSRCRSPNSCQR